MAGSKVTAYESTKYQVVNNYRKCFTLAVIPLAISYLLGIQSGHTVPVGRGSKKLGLASLLVTVPLTVVTTGIAVVGALANTAYGGIALPASAINDKMSRKAEAFDAASVQNNEDSAEELVPSTEKMLDLMPKQKEQITKTVAANTNTVTASSQTVAPIERLDVDEITRGYAV